MNSVIFMIISALLTAYGIYHLNNYEGEKKGLGYVETKGIVLSQYNYTPPRINSTPGATGSYYQRVKFSINSEEYEAEVYVSGTPSDSDIGKETDLLVNIHNLSDVQTGSFARQKYTALAVITVSFLGFLISGFFTYKRFFM